MDETTAIQESITENSINPTFNPFPGLRPFGIEESHLFFGREGQSEEVLKYLSANRFVAVIGASGSGKSSLIYCGLVPVIYGGFITDAGSHWRIITTRPGSDPINNLGEALLRSEKTLNQSQEDYQINKNIVQTLLHTSSLGLVEGIKILKKPVFENILLIVDQFEELFRYKQSRKNIDTYNESEAYVKLLVDAARQQEVPIYIVLTMRSDFIGDCSQFQELTELINLSNYLIPQMTRENFREAITGPVAVGGGAIESNLVHQLLNDIGDNPDQLPILQHALMRTWDHWVKQGNINRPMSIEDYEAVGKMEKALSEHANEAFDELSQHGKEICPAIFKRLTERGNDNRGIRRPSRVEEMAEMTQTDINEIIQVIDIFRKVGRSFLTPSYEVTLNRDSVIDISHESLMRIWNKLRQWVEEEASSVQMYMRLSEAAELFQMGKTGLWRPPDLHMAVSWKSSQKPTLTWAKRYNPAFERTMVYLETSENEFKAEELNKIKLQKKALQRTRIFALVLGIAAIIAIGLMIYSYVLSIEAKKQKVMAEKQKSIAEEQKKFAEQQKEEADKQKLLALNNEKEALNQKENAERQRIIAFKNAKEANIQKENANQQSQEAIKQRQLAEKNATEALDQKNLAEMASSEATKLRMLSISKSMAVKSVQITDDIGLKALLAYQAYLFYIKYSNDIHQADIYKGLYEGLKYKREKDFNKYHGHIDVVTSALFAPGSDNFYSIGDDGQILKWNIQDTSKKATAIYQDNAPLKIVQVSPDGNWLICSQSNSIIQLFDLKNISNQPVLFAGHNGIINSLLFINNDQFLSTAGDNTIVLWGLKEKSQQIISTLPETARTLAINPDKNKLAIGCDDGNLYIQNYNNPSDMRTIYQEKDNTIFCVTFNHKGNWLASGDRNGFIRIWSMDENKFIYQNKAHQTRVNDIRFSPDDKILASASFDRTIKLWETDDLNNQPYVLDDHEAWVFSIDFDYNGKKLISCGADNNIIIWPTQIKDLADKLYVKLTRNLTPEEWNTYVAKDIPYEKTCKELP